MRAVMELIDTASALGICIEVSGDKMLMKAASEPPPAVVDALIAHKPQIVALLSEPKGSVAWSRSEWNTFYEHRVELALLSDKTLREVAEQRAYTGCIVEWLNQHPVSSKPGQCAACGNPNTRGTPVVPFGIGPHVWLHSECWSGWSAKRRASAEIALAECGICNPHCRRY